MKIMAKGALPVLALVFFSFRAFLGLDAVTTAIKAGNVTQLSPYLDYRVDITLEDKSDTYSKTQAEMVIRDFFNNAGVRNFEIRRQSQTGDLHFCQGILTTRNGNYYTSFFLRHKGDRDFLQEIRFEK